MNYIEIAPDKVPAIARSIYRARSAMAHGAGALPLTAAYGGGQQVNVRTAAALTEASMDGWCKGQVPPVAWFLWAVAVAHRNFISKRLGLQRCPAGECTDDDAVAETP